MTSAPPPEPTAPVKEGDVLAHKYRVERVLGIGGMGAVVAARHLDLDELRALKFMLPKVSADQEAAKRFLREARAAGRIRSENVATIHDVGRLEGGEPYMVMEYLDGEDLRDVLKRRGKLPIDEAVDLTLQALAGLAEAHALGIVHRDLKPPNLFVCEGSDGLPRMKILDFGVSKWMGPVEVPELDMTKTNAMLGSPHYMSPEQMECTRDVDARTDIWSIGVLLYEMLTGEVPFDAPTITALTVLVVNREPVPPSKRRRELPLALEAVVLRCLAKNPDDRYGSVADVALALAPFAPAHAKALPERIERVVETLRARDPLPSLAEDDVAIRPTRPATPMAQDRSKTTASWGDADPGDSHKLRRGVFVLAALAIGAVAIVALARPWQQKAAPEPATPLVEEPPPPEPEAAPPPPPSATAAPSASVRLLPLPPQKKGKTRRPDIYEGLDRSDDPYDEPRDDPYNE